MSKTQRIAVIADVHIGNFKQHGGPMVDGLNTRGRMAMTTFRAALVKARELRVEALFIAGDLFQSRRPEPAILAGVMKALVEETSELPVVILPGNHDMLDASAVMGNTACEPLYKVATIVNEPTTIEMAAGGVLVVPFQGGMNMGDHLANVLESVHGAPILVTHVGVYDDNSPHWCKDAPDAIHKDRLFELMLSTGIETTFVGNFHHMHGWSMTSDDGRLLRIIQCGTLIPHGHSDGGQFPAVGAMWLFDGEDLEPVEIGGPRFLSIGAATSGGLDRALVMALPNLREGSGSTPYEVLATEPMIAPDAEGSTSADLPQAQDAIEAIGYYVTEQKLPEGIDMADAKSHVLSLWGRAGGG